jgi:hypothetical protein
MLPLIAIKQIADYIYFTCIADAILVCLCEYIHAIQLYHINSIFDIHDLQYRKCVFQLVDICILLFQCQVSIIDVRIQQLANEGPIELVAGNTICNAFFAQMIEKFAGQ